jgi:hypothetical protein
LRWPDRWATASCFDHAGAESFAEIVVNDRRYRLQTDDIRGRRIKEKEDIPLVHSLYADSKRTKVPN